MLRFLHIENIAVIERAEIELFPGLNVLTGETGAGKSIIIDSIGAILGYRTSRELVRTGADRAFVSAVFSGLSGDALSWLEANGHEAEDGELILQRELRQDGRGVCRIGGRPAAVSTLRELGGLLLGIHGQHDSQRLFDESSHLLFLDAFAGISAPLSDYRNEYNELLRLRREIDGAALSDEEKEHRIDILNYRIGELQNARLRPGEDGELSARRRLLSNSGKVIAALEAAYGFMYQNDEPPPVYAQLSNAASALGEVDQVSPELSGVLDRIEDMRYAAQDIAFELRGLLEGFDFSPQELEEIEERLDALSRIKSRYGGSVEAAIDRLERYKAELSDIELSGERLESLRNQHAKRLEIVTSLAEELSGRRKGAALELEDRIKRELFELDMKNVGFRAAFEELEAPAQDGIDGVRFLFSANLGEELRALSKVASGGELSRIMLAMRNAMSGSGGVGTMVFDEVDAGVSGRAAQKVAEKLFEVSRDRQVLCVTHLAQIAAMADHHFKIEKSEREGRTFTGVALLDEDGRKDELARITTGGNITETALSGAGEMIEFGKLYKKQKNMDGETEA